MNEHHHPVGRPSGEKPSISLNLKPWLAPNFAHVEMPPRHKQDGAHELPSFHVRDLPVEALDRLAEQWRHDLYEKAGKPLPEDRRDL